RCSAGDGQVNGSVISVEAFHIFRVSTEFKLRRLVYCPVLRQRTAFGIGYSYLVCSVRKAGNIFIWRIKSVRPDPGIGVRSRASGNGQAYRTVVSSETLHISFTV